MIGPAKKNKGILTIFPEKNKEIGAMSVKSARSSARIERRTTNP